MKIFIVIISIFISASAQQIDDQNLFRLGQAFEQHGEYERALQLYTQLHNKDSNNYQYFDAVRRTNVQLKHYSEAIRISHQRLLMTPYDFNLQANIGSLFSIAGKKEQADSVWNEILRSSKKNQMVYRSVANEQTNQRLFDKAIETYRRGREDIGDQFIFANELGYLYSFLMDYENAVREYLLLLRQNDLQYDFVQSRIASFVTRDEGLRAAIKIVHEEILHHQTIPLLRLEMWLSMEDNRYNDAFIIARKIEDLVHSNGMEIFQFAEKAFREKAYLVALSAYWDALHEKLTSQFVQQAKFGYARCTEELSLASDSSLSLKENNNTSIPEKNPSFQQAIEIYLSLAKEFPGTNVSANALYRIGMIRYNQLYDLDGARQIFDSVLTVSPVGTMVPQVVAMLGELYVVQGKLDEAEKQYHKITVSPFSNAAQRTMARYRIAELQYFKFNFDSALALMKPLTQNLKADETNDALILQYFITENQFQFNNALREYARAELFARQKKFGEAVKMLQEIVETFPQAPLSDDALLRIGEYLIRLHKYQGALSSYQKLLDDFKFSTKKDKAYFNMGEIYQLYLGDKQKAIQSYEVILEKYPFSLLAEEARKRIRFLRGDTI